MYCGTPTFWQRGLWDSCFQNPSESSAITPDILFGILSVLDLNRPFDITFWAACLVGFFTFFRKSNLLIPALEKFDPSKHLCRSDVQLGASGAIITVRWSKTI